MTHNVGPYEIWAGNPARFIRKRFDDDTIQILLESKWWDWSDDELYKTGFLFKNHNQFIKFLKSRKCDF